MLSFIKNNFNVNERKYSITIIFLDSTRLALNITEPINLHIVVEVFHEIADLHSENAEQKRENEETAMVLDYLIEILC